MSPSQPLPDGERTTASGVATDGGTTTTDETATGDGTATVEDGRTNGEVTAGGTAAAAKAGAAVEAGADAGAGGPPVVELDNAEIVYDRHFMAVQGVSMAAAEGDIVALLGPNGAGKSTILKTISGVGRSERAEVTRGQVRYDGEDVTNSSANEMVERGVTHILEGRRVFEDLTVEENLRCGLYRSGRRVRFSESDYELAFEYFPQLQDILDIKAGYASGGEQQMLVVGRALLHRPRLLLLDEPSLGLAPKLVRDLFATLTEINRSEGITMIVADQNAKRTLDVADYGYVLENGQVELHDPAEELQQREEIKEFYLGTSREESRYTDIRHYKIRKRWT